MSNDNTVSNNVGDYRLSSWLVVCVVSLAFWRPFSEDINMTPSDIVCVLTICYWGYLFLFKGMGCYIPKTLLYIMMAMLSFIGIASVFAYFKFDIPFLEMSTGRHLARLFLGWCVCLLIMTVKHDDITLDKKILYSLLAPIVLVFFVFSPQYYLHFYPPRFEGLSGNPLVTASILFPAYLTALVLAIMASYKRQFLLSVMLYLVGGVLLFMLFKTRSRGYIGGACLGSIIIFWLMIRQSLKRYFLWGAMIAGLFAIILYTLPMSVWYGYLFREPLTNIEECLAKHLDVVTLPASVAHRQDKFYYIHHTNLLSKMMILYNDTTFNPRVELSMIFWRYVENSYFIGMGINNMHHIFGSLSSPLIYGPETIVDLFAEGGVGLFCTVIYLLVFLYKVQKKYFINQDNDPISFAAYLILAISCLPAIIIGMHLRGLVGYKWILVALAYPRVALKDPRNVFCFSRESLFRLFQSQQKRQDSRVEL